MKRGLMAVFALMLGLSWTAMSLSAHHSFASQFDPSQPIEFEGVIKGVEWRNPHIWLYVDVTDASGRVVTWGFSGAPPSTLARRGITQEQLKAGELVKVAGFRARDGSNNASGGSVTFADGRNVFTASSEDAVPGQE